ncbi:MAG TPA: phage minor head protein [Ottowia sp.]|nr:phage minor head protein [Ottowia sp.]
MRPAHRAWHNLVLPVAHEFWSTHWPPNGWRCRCRVIALTRRDYTRGHGQSRPNAEIDDGFGTGTGRSAPIVREPFNTTAPADVRVEHVNRRTGEITAVPVGVDPGFGYNAGQARQRVLEQIQQSKQAAADPRLAAAARRDGLTLESAAATFYERARLNPRAKQPYLALAPASSDTVERARRIGIELEGKTVGLDHDGVRHVLTHSIARESLRGQVPLSPSDVALFPKLLAMATLAPGVPPFAPDGARLMTGRVVLEGFAYDLVVKVRRASIVLLTMYKRAE